MGDFFGAGTLGAEAECGVGDGFFVGDAMDCELADESCGVGFKALAFFCEFLVFDFEDFEDDVGVFLCVEPLAFGEVLVAGFVAGVDGVNGQVPFASDEAIICSDNSVADGAVGVAFDGFDGCFGNEVHLGVTVSKGVEDGAKRGLVFWDEQGFAAFSVLDEALGCGWWTFVFFLVSIAILC